MACSPRHRKHCNPSHERVVSEYRDARYTWERQLEDATALYDAEVSDYKRDNPGPTFKEWLLGLGGQRDYYTAEA